MDPNPLPPPAEEVFLPALPEFRQRVKWIRTFVLDITGVAEMARRLKEPASTVTTWEKGTIPHNQGEIARKYHEVAPMVPVKWILYGQNGHLVTYADGLVIVDEGQLILPIELPPSKSNPALTLV